MSGTIHSLGIDRLSVADRLRLAEEIWESVASEAEDAPLSEAQRRELSRRLEAHRADSDDMIPWETIEADALARMRS